LEKATINAALLSNDRTQRPGELPVSDHFKQRHKFEALTDKIKNEEGVPKSQALSLARVRYPEIYNHYVGSGAGKYFKRGPTTFEDLVNVEMAKGCNYEIAAQRVMQLHGANALHYRTINKRAARAEDAEGELIKRADDIWCDDPGMDRCEALRKARQENPRLFKALQDC
jgi:hypothetical protein